jgi:hypothetical protein
LKDWAKSLTIKAKKDLKEVKDMIQVLFDNNDAGTFSKEELNELKYLEDKKKIFCKNTKLLGVLKVGPFGFREVIIIPKFSIISQITRR